MEDRGALPSQAQGELPADPAARAGHDRHPTFQQHVKPPRWGARCGAGDTMTPMSTASGADPFAEDEDQAALRRLTREVSEREIGPRAAHWDETGEVPYEAIKALAAADLFRVTIGEQWGGLGFGDVEAAIVLEEVARYDVSAQDLKGWNAGLAAKVVPGQRLRVVSDAGPVAADADQLAGDDPRRPIEAAETAGRKRDQHQHRPEPHRPGHSPRLQLLGVAQHGRTLPCPERRRKVREGSRRAATSSRCRSKKAMSAT